MDSDIVGSILLQVVLIAVNAVFACAEIAVVSCNDAKLEKMAQEGNKKAETLVKLIEDHPDLWRTGAEKDCNAEG